MAGARTDAPSTLIDPLATVEPPPVASAVLVQPAGSAERPDADVVGLPHVGPVALAVQHFMRGIPIVDSHDHGIGLIVVGFAHLRGEIRPFLAIRIELVLPERVKRGERTG